MCGLCLPHCPTYSVAKNEAESPRGRIALIRALHENKLQATHSLVNHLDTCLACMKCEAVCPANVDYELILNAGREITHEQHTTSYRFRRSFFLFVLTKPAIRNVTKLLLGIYQNLGLRYLFKYLYKFFPNGLRILKIIPNSQKTEFSKLSAHETRANDRVILINSCAGDLFSDSTKHAATHVLQALGCEAVEKSPVQCCGALAQHSGDIKKAKHLEQQFTMSLINENYAALVSLATGCGAQINRNTKLSNKHVDINSFVLQKLEERSLQFKPLSGKVFIHKPCTHKNVSANPQVIEQLLGKIPAIQLAFFSDELACCGAGGINVLMQTTLADEIVASKIDELTASNANYLVTSNIGCALHFQANLHNHRKLTVCHPITLLAQQLL